MREPAVVTRRARLPAMGRWDPERGMAMTALRRGVGPDRDREKRGEEGGSDQEKPHQGASACRIDPDTLPDARCRRLHLVDTGPDTCRYG